MGFTLGIETVKKNISNTKQNPRILWNFTNKNITKYGTPLASSLKNDSPQKTRPFWGWTFTTQPRLISKVFSETVDVLISRHWPTESHGKIHWDERYYLPIGNQENYVPIGKLVLFTYRYFYVYIYHKKIKKNHVGKYASPMDPMGLSFKGCQLVGDVFWVEDESMIGR